MKGLHIGKRKIAVIGFGVSGKSVSRFFMDNGVQVDVYEDKKAEEFDHASIAEFVADPNFTIYFSGAALDVDIMQYDYVIASPGVPLTHALVTKAKQEGVEFVTDITIFLRLFRARYPYGTVISITGSNGKSTTVSLMIEALKAAGLDAYLGGNIGTSPLDFFTEIKSEMPVIILETSSYQLEYLKDEDWFDIAGITNISDNHLNRYGGDKEVYAKAKLGGIDPEHTSAIINFDDAETKKYIVPFLPTKKVLGVEFESGFSDNVISLEGDSLVYRKNGESVSYVDSVSAMRIKGLHNAYNAAFVCAVLALLDVEPSTAIATAIINFSGLIHRTQMLGEIDDVAYINDSKSTTPDATNKALETVSISKNVILISGGNDKDISYESLKENFNSYVKSLILLPGTANPKIKAVAERTGVALLAEIGTMQEAVDVARASARPGDIVLLSPATDSHASFRSFEDRGNQFIECVKSLRASS